MAPISQRCNISIKPNLKIINILYSSTEFWFNCFLASEWYTQWAQQHCCYRQRTCRRPLTYVNCGQVLVVWPNTGHTSLHGLLKWWLLALKGSKILNRVLIISIWETWNALKCTESYNNSTCWFLVFYFVVSRIYQ